MADIEIIKRRRDGQEALVLVACTEAGRKWIIQEIVLNDGFDVDNFESVFIRADYEEAEEFVKRIQKADLAVEVS